MLDTVLDYSFDPVYLIGSDLSFRYVNKAAERFLGYTKDELLAMNLCQIDPYILIGKVTDIFQSTPDSECALNIFDTLHRRKDGTSFPVEVGLNSFVYSGQKVVLAIARDISSRKEFERKIQKREEDYRSLAENSPDYIIRYDLDCRVVYLNTRLAQVLGVTQTQILGLRPSDIWPDDRFAELEVTVRQVLETGLPTTVEVSTVFDGVGFRCHQISFLPECDKEAVIQGVIAFGRDVTEFKNAQRALEHSQTQLRALAARSDEIREQERLHMAREIHDDLGQKLSTLRMELATLQMQFGGTNPILEEGCLHALFIADEAIKTVRAISTALRPASLDMGVASAIEWLAQEFQQSTGITCEVQIEESFICTDDEHSIHKFRIVQESLANVARHAKASHVVIRLEGDCEQVRLSVRDDGVGFDACASKPGSFGHIGIRERALLIGGKAAISSSPGQGTTVCITSPRHHLGGTQS